MGSSAVKDRLQLAAPIVSILLYAVVLFFNYAASQPDSLGIFHQSTGNVSNKYETSITPPGYTFIIWAVIYTWIAVGLIYALTQLCRRGEHGPVYLTPVTLPLTFWLVFNANQCLNVGWLFIWDGEYLTAAAVVLVLTCLANWVTMFFLVTGLYHAVRSQPAPTLLETVFVRAFVHNGLAVYTAWTTVAAIINTAIGCIYAGEFSNATVSAVLAGVLAAGVIVFLALELTVLDKYTRWVITPGFVLVWAVGGVFDKNGPRTSGATYAMLVVLLAVVCVCLAVRLAALVVRLVRDRSRGGLTVTKASTVAPFSIQ